MTLMTPWSIGVLIGVTVLILVYAQIPAPDHTQRQKQLQKVSLRMLGEYEVYLINLDEATDRLNHFRSEFYKSDLARERGKSFIRVSAVNGRAIDVNTMVSKRALEEIVHAEATGFRLRHYQLSRGGVGCYSSHVHCWRNLLQTDKQVALIFEDDAQIHPKIGAFLATTPVPEDYDILLLGYVCFKCAKARRLGWHKVRRFFGLHGYLINAKTVRKILSSPRIFPIRQQIDAVLSDMAEAGELKIYASTRKFVEQNNEEFNTQIQIPIKQGAFDPWALPD